MLFSKLFNHLSVKKEWKKMFKNEKKEEYIKFGIIIVKTVDFVSHYLAEVGAL